MKLINKLKAPLFLIFLLLSNCNKDIVEVTPDIQYNTTISIVYESDQIHIEIYDYPEIAGFQFDLYTNDNLQINSFETHGGISDDNNFTVSTGLSNLRILGFNLSGETINSAPLESHILLYIDLDYAGTGKLGIKNIILSGVNGQNIPFQVQQDLVLIP